jgi:hypothetical protein
MKIKNIKVGIAINPTTDIHQLDNLFNKIDLFIQSTPVTGLRKNRGRWGIQESLDFFHKLIFHGL